jgi:hypothetical protein
MSHYYNELGEPCHTSIGAKGQEVKTTVTHARKRGLYPSVTTVLSDVLAKGSLERWKFRQLTDACYANPSIQKGQYKWTPEAYASEMVKEAFDKVEKAADLGTDIHAAIEAHFEGHDFDFSKTVDLPSGESVELVKYCEWVSDWVVQKDVQILDCELRLVNKEYGYAGLTDATINHAGNHGILDFKTRRTKEGEKIKPYDEHPCQIAAYHIAKYGSIDENSIGCNLYISTTEPGRVEAVWYDAEQLSVEWEKFKHTLAIWKILKKYDPTKATK